MGLETFNRPLSLVTLEDPALRELARPLRSDELLGPAISAVVARMWRALDSAGGVGLAAPQVGLPLAIFLVKFDETRAAYANPIHAGFPSIATELGREGCLSLPGYRADVMRPKSVMIEAFRLDGPRKGRGPITIVASDWLARIYCHEIDHLRGMLYVDRALPGTMRANEPTILEMPVEE